MKIQFDTVLKTIKIEENIKLNDLIITLDKLFPQKEWIEFTLETNTIIQNWSYPIYIEKKPYEYWWQAPWVNCVSNNAIEQPEYPAKYTLNNGTFNIEI